MATGSSRPQPAFQPEPSPATPTYIVGIGASAGGVESLGEFFERMDSESGMAFIVVQHLSPTYRSLMAELLAPRTRMRIYHAETGMPVEPNSIYLNPPKRDILIRDGRIELQEQERGQNPPLPIDRFFQSLAATARDKAIAVVLSGCGSDGSRGIVAIKNAGGLVVVQDVLSAKFDGMPSSAIRTGVTDMVVSPADMPEALLRHAGRQDSEHPNADEGAISRSDTNRIFELLRQRYDIDFKLYKPGMIQRRIERRLLLSRFGSMEHFIETLRDDPQELDKLYHDFLIGVTSFFRDDHAFATIAPELRARVKACEERGDTFRAWIAGCASGEEAYSLAILLHEVSGAEVPNIKIFATDIHQAALQTASAAVYTREELRNVSDARIDRFFVPSGAAFKVAPEIRRTVIFTQHNVLTDAPFAALDVISCRNLLIYFEVPAQNKVLAAFNYALKPNGLLLLGSSENIGDLSAHLEALDPQARLFRKNSEVVRGPARSLAKGDMRFNFPQPRPQLQRGDSALMQAYQQLLHRFVPPSLLVTEQGELLHSFGNATLYLDQREGRASLNVLDLVEDELRVAIAAGLQRVVRKGAPTTFEGIRISGEEGQHLVRLTIDIVAGRQRDPVTYLLTIEPMRPAVPTPIVPAEFQVKQESLELISGLEQELQYTKEHLYAVVEEIEVSNEELQSANEELVSSNEELQSTNEELQSVNEELVTVNDEFKAKIEELTELTNDMEHLLLSTDVGVIFLDRDLRIRRFTPAIAQSFNLLPQDLGRPIDHISHKLQYPCLVDDIQAVMGSGTLIEREIHDLKETPLFCRILPYRTPSAGVSGVVLTVVDISIIKTAEKDLRISEEKFSCLVEHLDAVFWMTDGSDEHLLYESQSAQSLVGRLVAAPHSPRSWTMAVLPEDQERVAEFTSRDRSRPWEAEYRLLIDFATRWVRERVFPVFDDLGRVYRVIGFVEDITRRKQDEHSRLLTQFAIDRAADCVYWLGENGRIVYCNDSGANLFGYRPEELIRSPFDEFHKPQDGQLWYDFLHGQKQRDTIHFESTIRDRKAALKPVELNASRISVEGENYVCVIMHDVSERNRRYEIFEQMNSVMHRNRELDEFTRIASHDLKEPLRALLTFTSLLEEDLGDQTTQQVCEDLAHIQQSARRMQQLINDLLQLSRASSAETEFKQIPLSLCVNDALELLEASRRELNPDIFIDPLPEVYGDRTLISQLCQNLIGNALKFVDGHKAVIRVTAEHDGHEWVFGVKDNGVGIKPEHLEMVFQPFKRVGVLGRDGSGIGLAICRKIVERHGGRLWAESTPGEGSHFRFTLSISS